MLQLFLLSIFQFLKSNLALCTLLLLYSWTKGPSRVTLTVTVSSPFIKWKFCVKSKFSETLSKSWSILIFHKMFEKEFKCAAWVLNDHWYLLYIYLRMCWLVKKTTSLTLISTCLRWDEPDKIFKQNTKSENICHTNIKLRNRIESEPNSTN